MTQGEIVVHPQLLEMINSMIIATGVAIAGMAGAFMFIVRWLMAGMDKRDKTNTDTVETFQEAVKSWREFETDQKLFNKEIQTALSNIVTQLKILNHSHSQEPVQ